MATWHKDGYKLEGDGNGKGKGKGKQTPLVCTVSIRSVAQGADQGNQKNVILCDSGASAHCISES